MPTLCHLSYPVVLDELLHVVLSQVVCFNVGLYELLVWDWSEVGELLQLHQELLEVQLHQCTSFITAFLHISIAGRQTAEVSVAQTDIGHSSTLDSLCYINCRESPLEQG